MINKSLVPVQGSIDKLISKLGVKRVLEKSSRRQRVRLGGTQIIPAVPGDEIHGAFDLSPLMSVCSKFVACQDDKRNQTFLGVLGKTWLPKRSLRSRWINHSQHRTSHTVQRKTDTETALMSSCCLIRWTEILSSTSSADYVGASKHQKSLVGVLIANDAVYKCCKVVTCLMGSQAASLLALKQNRGGFDLPSPTPRCMKEEHQEGAKSAMSPLSPLGGTLATVDASLAGGLDFSRLASVPHSKLMLAAARYPTARWPLTPAARTSFLTC